MTVAAVATTFLMWPGAVRAGLEEDIAELRKELAEIKKEIAESILQITLKPPLAVRVTTDKRSYHRGEPIVVTIRNDLSSIIYAVPGQTYCSVFSVQRLEAGQWETKGSCDAEGSIFFITIAPKSEKRGVVGPAAQDAVTQIRAPMVSGPVAPDVFKGDLRMLPPAEPPQPGEPAREVPQGMIPPKTEKSPEGEIGPGSYRIEFRFTAESRSGPVQRIYSNEFVVID
jgi:hypothetical protein